MRPWLVIPAAAVVGAATGALLGGPLLAIALGAAAAAITAAVRALLGDAPAALAAAVMAALIVVAIAGAEAIGARPLLAIAGLAWTIAELARTTSSPMVAMLPALIAGIADATLVPLVPLAATRLVTAPWRRPRWVIAVPIAASLATLVAVLLLASPTGDAWAGRAFAPATPLAAQLALLGPFVVVAAACGLPSIAGRGRYVQVALVAALAGALLGDLRAGTAGGPTLALAALLTGLALGRLAGSIRLPLGQAVIVATLGAIIVLPPALLVVDHQVVVFSAK